MTSALKQNLSAFLRLITPSRSGALLSVVIGIIVVLAIMTPKFYELTDLDSYITYIGQSPANIYAHSQEASDLVNNSKFAADASVFIVWSIAGLIGYALIAALVRQLKNTREFIRELEYSERHRKDIEREALIHALLRILAACLILVFYLLLMNFLLPLVVVCAQMALGSSSIMAVVYTMCAVLITLLCVHTAVVLTRLVLLRTRIFFS